MRILVAIALLILGILGIALPVLPGIPFLIAFLYVLGVLKRDRFLKLLRRYRGKRNSLQRKVVSCILIKLVYRRSINIK